ncbi:MAG: response regulator transcription factor [Chloroflexi bacterium]|nr:response regulator transcription factor [Chloroflexota bacterium]
MTSHSAKILVVDDDPEVLAVVEQRLKLAGYRVEAVETSREALRSFFEQKADLALLDVGLPDIDGFELCSRIREVSDIPVIFLTGRGTETDRVRGLRAGADDYIVKPFGAEELLARVEAALRRASMAAVGPANESYSDGEITVDIDAHVVTLRGTEISLSPHEYRMLLAFVRHPNQVLSQDQLLDMAWGADALEASRDSVRLYVGYLRAKIERDPRKPQLIRTVREFGYSYRPPPKIQE